MIQRVSDETIAASTGNEAMGLININGTKSIALAKFNQWILDFRVRSPLIIFRAQSILTPLTTMKTIPSNIRA